MFKNKLISKMIIIMLSLTLIGSIAVIVTLKYTEQASTEKGPSIDDVIKASVDVTDIKTNLKSNNYISISFKIQMDSKKAAAELQKRDFQVRDIIIKRLSDMSAKDFEGVQGLSTLETDIAKQIDQLMENGHVVKIYTTSKVLQ
ncbi:flagellar basal body-associated protein FliL [Priestia megaterium]|uniref:flagellar basal body-associated protein FliL n=1 Tax=Priestia megaterium TaxID=1404 RepID=UPI00070FD8C6|nr:flagellar basal body-associated protein FliL [Priestia megaterium]KRE05448.1 flagellar basal body-associated protein FliL [Bacillus sp. Root239]MBU8686128.1 flagellar basal body-associated protein FliL [Priestia megaterium]MCM3542818.1 flagellar basal body-associated protein FliL [Priestia megaterium]MDI3094334.1 flagellar basal body-associated protein FliL [Priestia megaterium]MEC1067306.1 flagellar basal body-associated protein FliL [Priestia megaterium]